MSDSGRSTGTTCIYCGRGQRILDPCPACGRQTLYLKDGHVVCAHFACQARAVPAPQPCILNGDSPSYPPETDEYRQCGCRLCLVEYNRRMSAT